MPIKASCKYDLNAVRALIHLSMFKKANPKKRLMLWIILFAISCILIIAEAIVLGYARVLMCVLCINIFAVALLCFWFFAAPKIRYKALAKMQDVENLYIFYDDCLKVFSGSKEYTGEAEIAYSLFVKVYETSEYIFLYQTKNQVFVVDKSTVADGTVEDIRSRLSDFAREKYIICSY